MAAHGEFVPVQAVGLGVDRNLDPHLQFLPDLEGVDLGVVDFAQVRSLLGLSPDAPLHVLSDLDLTLRHNHADCVDEDVARNVQHQLATGAITSFHIATNSLQLDLDRFGPQIGPDTHVFVPERHNPAGGLVRKQHAAYYERIVGTLGIANEAVLAVGDKYRRDVLGGNRAGLFTMRVMPLPGPDLWFDRFGLRTLDNYAGQLGRRALAGLARPAIADTI